MYLSRAVESTIVIVLENLRISQKKLWHKNDFRVGWFHSINVKLEYLLLKRRFICFHKKWLFGFGNLKLEGRITPRMSFLESDSFNGNTSLCSLEESTARYHDGYGRLRSWAYRSLDLYKVTCLLHFFKLHLWNCSFSMSYYILVLHFFAAWVATCSLSSIYPLLHGSCGKRASPRRYEIHLHT